VKWALPGATLSFDMEQLVFVQPPTISGVSTTLFIQLQATVYNVFFSSFRAAYRAVASGGGSGA